MVKIGVFDSGVGGLRVSRTIARALPNVEVIYKNDEENVPYGTKSTEEIFGLVVPKLRELETTGCQVIVIACNTVTTTLIDRLKLVIDIPLIGIEPMIEESVAQTKNRKIAVCATPVTLASKRYAELKNQFTKNVMVYEPDCSDWAFLIEHNRINMENIHKQIEPVLESGADVIVLGCTHYHWIEETIKDIANSRAIIVQPEEYTIALVKKEIARLV